MGVSREGRVVVYSDLYRCTMPQSVQSLCVMMKTSKTKLIPVSVHLLVCAHTLILSKGVSLHGKISEATYTYCWNDSLLKSFLGKLLVKWEDSQLAVSISCSLQKLTSNLEALIRGHSSDVFKCHWPLKVFSEGLKTTLKCMFINYKTKVLIKLVRGIDQLASAYQVSCPAKWYHHD